ncbi:UbiA family prenyltransferase [Novosphingobium sp. FSY-8]|uniref:UbiA family prenyltransferase n=1 Tax=Novosphingobium ovatum TaxID=1908523 RepID=A0ABW9XD93_9SPHN|nr:UbiA family prenyltransferase [Novosphingobium ovatum]NBC36506.1 UbiA family prenyltransferase [Novosphingobium ovatum]
MLHERIGEDVPLVVDLDRTLITGDVAMEAMVELGKRGFWAILGMVWMFLRGRSNLKTLLARRMPVDPATLAYRPQVLELIAQARASRRPVILASAAHWRTAHRVAAHLGLFDRVIASTHAANVKGSAKLAAIRAAVGDKPFDYVGDCAADRPIWRAARVAYTVDAPTGTAQQERIAPRGNIARALLKAARPHQWAKNALVFVPLASSGMLANVGAIGASLLAFIAMSVIASSVYLLNDLLDIEADRLHPKKRKRPLASGALPIPVALVATVLAAVAGLGAAWLLGVPSFSAMACYFALTLAYSMRLKAAMIADVLTLACLYTIRIVAGAAAIGVPVSFWLLLFSTFFFLSLGYLKRYVELRSSPREEHELLSGRGYTRSDTEIVAISGLAAGMVSILVLVLFAEAMAKTGAYATPQLLWLLPLPLLYWLNRVWMMGRRGQVDSDPVAFAITDPKSIGVAGMLGVILIAAKFAPLGGALTAMGITLG